MKLGDAKILLKKRYQFNFIIKGMKQTREKKVLTKDYQGFYA